MTEYKVEKVARHTSAKELEDRLNGLAKDGWELSAVDPRDGRTTLYILSRESREAEVTRVAGFVTSRPPKTENL